MPANLPVAILERGYALVEIAKKKGYVFGQGSTVTFPLFGSTMQAELDAIRRKIIVADVLPPVPDLGIYIYVDPQTGRLYKSNPDGNEWQQVNEVDEMFTDPK